MRLEFSAFARERSFAKAMHRIRPKLQPLLDELATIELQHPSYEAILVGITDDKDSEFFEEVPNDDGYFQVIAGCAPSESDSELAQQVFEILRQAVRACPLASADHELCEALFGRFESSLAEK
ncbi:MAG: hypothetical protein WD063_06810 [Pirellulales bacterium]